MKNNRCFLLFIGILLSAQVSCISSRGTLREAGGFRLYYEDKDKYKEGEYDAIDKIEDFITEISGKVKIGTKNKKIQSTYYITFSGKNIDGIDTVYSVKTNKKGEYKILIYPDDSYSISVNGFDGKLYINDIDLGREAKKNKLDLYIHKDSGAIIQELKEP